MRNIVFYGLLSVPIVAWCVIVLPHYIFGADEFSAALVSATISASPMITGDLSILGELTPAALAAAVIAATPSKKAEVKIPGIILSILAYGLFLHLSIFFSSGPGAALVSLNASDPALAREIILKLVSNVRIMTIVTAVALLGYKLKAS